MTTNLLVQNPDLELVVLEHLLEVGLLHDETLERLLLLHDLLDQVLQDGEVAFGNLKQNRIQGLLYKDPFFSG